MKNSKETVGLKEDETSAQCKFYLKKKNRFCRFRPKLGQQYCPEHACILGVQTDRKRIPCPLNPKHNCYQDEVEKHMKKCNVTKIQQKVEKQVYYVKGVNRGSSGAHETSTSKSQIAVKDMTSDDLRKMIERVRHIYNAYVEPIESTYFQHACVHDEICASQQEDINSALRDQAALRKELLQQAALVGQMEREKFLDLENNCFVELGAGKGKLSHWIRKACNHYSKSKFVLVERGSVRYKVDGHQNQNEGDNLFTRIKMDIVDLFLGKVPCLDCSGCITIVGKHLCGGATDMGIRCAVNTLKFDQQNAPKSVASPQLQAEERTKVTAQQKTPNHIDTSQSFTKTESQKTSAVSGYSSPSFKEKKVQFTDMKGSSPSFTTCEGDAIDCFSCVSPSSVSVMSTHCDSPALNAGESLELRAENPATAGEQEKTQPLEEKKYLTDSRQEVTAEPPVKVQRTGEQTGERCRLPDGIMIALCCHHQCTWDTYVGKSFMQDCGLGPQEFDLLTRLSSWATCARVRVKSNTKYIHEKSTKNTSQTGKSEEPKSSFQEEAKEDHFSEDLINNAKNSDLPLREQLSVSEREKIGRQCKRIIDTGRLHYLRSKGLKATLREYIDEGTTPENVVLVAHP
ncbi:tRNA:m(4)X modification enzyme TRM13 homolog [Elysia marginata]|uniref:tRNA:m(4)X modification enzyme TRM13 n=1 Tax=Elysia marginata TaxID=1093978 RepID=A0AAV4G2X9_9GAST|nr:tRNA:m(4)X modification enzyme TRM13 homolog [Elysia marginata]